MEQATQRDQLQQWLEKAIGEGSPGSPLPGIRKLAETFNLSQRTVKRIIQALRKEGKIVTIRGKGLFIPGDAEPVDTDNLQTRSSSQIFIDFIMNAIATGQIRRGEQLPLIKYCTHRFNLSRKAVGEAYKILENKGYICRIGKGYWLGDYDRLVKYRGTKRIAFVNCQEQDFAHPFIGDVFAQSYQKMERELMDYGYNLDYYRKEEVAAMVKRCAKKNELAGCFITSTDFESFDLLKEPVERLCEIFKRDSGRIIIEGERFSIRKAGVKLLVRGNLATSKARTTAQFIWQQHMKNIVVFFDGRTAYSSLDIMIFYRLKTELQALGFPFSFTICAILPKKFKTRDAFFNDIYRQKSPDLLAKIFSKYVPTDFSDLEKSCVFVDEFEDMYKRLEKKDSIWVFEMERDAVAAKNWCNGHAAARGSVSILSYENLPEFYPDSITCCVCDWDRLGYLLAHALIDDIPVATTRQGFIKIPTCLIERHTTTR